MMPPPAAEPWPRPPQQPQQPQQQSLPQLPPPCGAAAGGASARPAPRFSTTSSVYAEHTLSDPNCDQVLYCIAAILQAQMFDDHDDPDSKVESYQEFELDIQLGPEYGGAVCDISAQVLAQETQNDTQLRQKLLSLSVPTCDTVYRFLSLLNFAGKYSVQCNIVALVYVNRITANSRMALTMKNWRGVWTSAVILAQKVWDDRPLRTSTFAQILPGVTKHQLRALELRAFTLLDYSAQVKPSVYAKYYFELRALFCDMGGGDQRLQWTLKPLTIIEGRRLEGRAPVAGKSLKATHSLPCMRADEAAQHSPCVRHAKMLVSQTLEDATFTRPASRYVLRM